jgi:MFS family permease
VIALTTIGGLHVVRSRRSDNSSGAIAQRQAGPGQSATILLPTVWLCVFLVSLDFSAINVAMPTLSSDFRATTSDVSWASMAYMLAMVMLSPIIGFLIGRIGGDRVLTLGLSVFGLASVAAALSGGLWMLVGMRAVQGIGGAIMYVIGAVLLREHVPEDRQQRAFSIYTTGPFAGLVAGPAVGGTLTEVFGWQAVFWMNIPLTLLALALSHAFFRRLPPDTAAGSPATPRLRSIASLSLCAGAVVLALNRGQEWGWSSAPTLGLLGLAALAAVLAVASERTAAIPLIDTRLLRIGSFTKSVLVIAAVSAGFGGFTFLLPFYFEWVRGLDTGIVGRIMSVQPIGTIVMSVALGVLPTELGTRPRCLAGIILLAGAFVTFVFAGIGTALTVLLAGLVVFGFGMGLTLPALLHTGMRDVPPDLLPVAGSLQGTARILAQLLGLVVFETVMSQFSHGAFDGGAPDPANPAAMLAGFRTACIVGIAIVVAAALPAMRIDTHPERTKEGLR